MDKLVLEAVPRTIGSKGQLSSLRRQDKIPAVVYGRGKDTQVVTVEGRPLRQALAAGGTNALINLKIKAKGKKSTEETVMFKNIQRDILLKDQILHVDFIRISMTDKIEVEIALNFTGESPGVKEGGILQLLKREITVRCLPAAIPDYIEVDISSLNIGDVLTAGSLQLDEGIELLTSPDELLVSVQAPAAVEEEPVEEAEEAEEGAAGAAAEEAEPPAGDAG